MIWWPFLLRLSYLFSLTERSLSERRWTLAENHGSEQPADHWIDAVLCKVRCTQRPRGVVTLSPSFCFELQVLSWCTAFSKTFAGFVCSLCLLNSVAEIIVLVGRKYFALFCFCNLESRKWPRIYRPGVTSQILVRHIFVRFLSQNSLNSRLEHHFKLLRISSKVKKVYQLDLKFFDLSCAVLFLIKNDEIH